MSLTLNFKGSHLDIFSLNFKKIKEGEDIKITERQFLKRQSKSNERQTEGHEQMLDRTTY